jgi:hypothetical protein
MRRNIFKIPVQKLNNSSFASSEKIINEEYKRLQITEALIGETMSSLPENGEWQNKLLKYLYNKLNGKLEQGNIKGELHLGNVGGDGYSDDAPSIDFIDYYLIDIKFRFVGEPLFKASCKGENIAGLGLIASFSLNFVCMPNTLLSQLYNFVYHEFLHCWQIYKLSINSKKYTTLTPYNIPSRQVPIQLKPYVDNINEILYFTNILERGAFTSQAIGELKYNYQHNERFAELPTQEQMESLFVTKQYSKHIQELNFLKGAEHTNIEEGLLGIINSELATQIGRTWKTYNSFVDVLSRRLKRAYKAYRQKVSKWLQYKRLNECITWFD